MTKMASSLSLSLSLSLPLSLPLSPPLSLSQHLLSMGKRGGLDSATGAALASLPFPIKRLFGSTSDETIEERKRALEAWLNAVLELVPLVSERDSNASAAALIIKGFLNLGDGSPLDTSAEPLQVGRGGAFPSCTCGPF
eukprot:COSAG01_NODE_1412_length_10404_cov_48.915478_5_plen_139_part_00